MNNKIFTLVVMKDLDQISKKFGTIGHEIADQIIDQGAQRISEKVLFGEIDDFERINYSDIVLSRASHIILRIYKDNNSLMCDVRFIDNEYGRIMRNVLSRDLASDEKEKKILTKLRGYYTENGTNDDGSIIRGIKFITIDLKSRR